MANCPFIQTECLKKRCQLWVPIAEKHHNCTFVAIPNVIKMGMPGLENAIMFLAKSFRSTLHK